MQRSSLDRVRKDRLFRLRRVGYKNQGRCKRTPSGSLDLVGKRASRGLVGGRSMHRLFGADRAEYRGIVQKKDLGGRCGWQDKEDLGESRKAKWGSMVACKGRPAMSIGRWLGLGNDRVVYKLLPIVGDVGVGNGFGACRCTLAGNRHRFDNAANSQKIRLVRHNYSGHNKNLSGNLDLVGKSHHNAERKAVNKRCLGIGRIVRKVRRPFASMMPKQTERHSRGRVFHRVVQASGRRFGGRPSSRYRGYKSAACFGIGCLGHLGSDSTVGLADRCGLCGMKRVSQA